MTDRDFLFFDSAPFIYLLEKHPDWQNLVEQIIFEGFDKGVRFATSWVSFAEFGVKPTRDNRPDLLTDFDELMRHADFEIRAIDRAIAEKSFQLRSKYVSLKLADALQLAAALDLKCTKFITNDHRLKPITEIEICLLNEFI